jgi:hypothetical protein
MYYYTLRQAVILKGTDVTSPILDFVTQAAIIAPDKAPNDFAKVFAQEVRNKILNNDTTPFLHLKKTDKPAKT